MAIITGTLQQISSYLSSLLPNIQISLSHHYPESATTIDYSGGSFIVTDLINYETTFPFSKRIMQLPFDYLNPPAQQQMIYAYFQSDHIDPDLQAAVVNWRGVANRKEFAELNILDFEQPSTNPTYTIQKATLTYSISGDGQGSYELESLSVVATVAGSGGAGVAMTYDLSQIGFIYEYVGGVKPFGYYAIPFSVPDGVEDAGFMFAIVPTGYFVNCAGLLHSSKPVIAEEAITFEGNYSVLRTATVSQITDAPGYTIPVMRLFVQSPNALPQATPCEVGLDPTALMLDWDEQLQKVVIRDVRPEGGGLAYDALRMTPHLEEILSGGGGGSADLRKRLIVNTPANASITNRPFEDLIAEGVLSGEFVDQFSASGE